MTTTVLLLVAAAVALKISLLVGIAVAVFRRLDRWPVYGVWYEEADERGRLAPAHDTIPRSPSSEVLSMLLDRDMRRIEISRSGDTVVVRSADGSPVSYGSTGCRVMRTSGEGRLVESTWERRGDGMRLESDAGGEGRVVETFQCAGEAMLAELRLTVPGSDVDRSVVRRFRRSQQP